MQVLLPWQQEEMTKMSEEKQPVLTNEDLRGAARRWLMAVNTFNYEGQLSSSVIFSLAPLLRKIYKNDDDYKEALNNHYKYFNCHPWLANLILGGAIAMEEKKGLAAKNTVQDFKVGLMGPLSGIGDTIIWVLIPTIMGSIGAYMAMEGNPFGMIAWALLHIICLFVRFRLFEIGYTQGMRIISEFGKQLTIFTEAASVLGLVVLGALIPSVVKISCPVTFKLGDVGMKLQPMLDKIMPSLLPILFTTIVYYLLSRKMKLTNLILLVIVFSMAASGFGLLK